MQAKNKSSQIVGRLPVLLAVCMLVIGLWMAPPLAAQNAPPRRVNGPQIATLIVNTIIALDQANKTGNYTVLRDLGSLTFRNLHNPATLATLYRPLRKAKLDMTGAVLLKPRHSKKPKLTRDGILQLKGFFPTKPNNVTFDLAYRFENRRWRIMSLSIGTRPAKAAGNVVTPKKKPGKKQ